MIVLRYGHFVTGSETDDFGLGLVLYGRDSGHEKGI